MHALTLALLVAAAQAGSEAPAASAAVSPAAIAPVLPAAAIEKMGQGDRAFLDRDYRGALFAYLDATYLAPASAAPRVKLGRAYLVLRHPARALEQAERALALDPGSAEATKLADESRAAVAAQPPSAGHPAKPAAAPAAARTFKFVPDGEAAAPAAAPAVAAAAAQAAVPAAAPAAAARVVAIPAAPAPSVPPPAPVAAPEPVRAAAAAETPAVQPLGGWGAQKYRQGLDHVRDRDFEKAVAVLTEAVTLDPRLAVAYAARASARFALGAYREAADDYRKAIDLDGKLATPLYGLAECHRALGERREAAEMYRRYADSPAADARDDLRALATKRAAELR